MKPIKKIMLAGLAALLAISKPAASKADFYDGVRGPTKAQIHYTLSTGEKTSHTLAAKYFGESLFAVGAATVDGKSVLGYFAGVGYVEEHLGRAKAIPLVGYSTSGNGKQGTLDTVLQATVFLDKEGTFLADPRYTMSVPMHGQEDHTPNHALGLTLSVGNERVRVGPDLNYDVKGKKVTGGALIRYDFDTKSHSSWMEMGFGTNGNAQLQFRLNF